MLSKDIAELMKLIQSEEARASERIKKDGPAVKGIAVLGVSFAFKLVVHFVTSVVFLHLSLSVVAFERKII